MATVNLTSLCGQDNFTVWDTVNEDFGLCFQNLVLVFPTQSLLAITSAYYLGFQSGEWYLRSLCQKYTVLARSLATLLMALLPFIKITGLYSTDKTVLMRHGEADLLASAVSCFSWGLHFVVSLKMYHRLSLSTRGPTPLLLSWVICFIVQLIQFRSCFLGSEHLSSGPQKLLFSLNIIGAVSQTVYLLTLLPGGDQTPSHYEEFIHRENDPLLSDGNGSPGFRRMAGSTNYGGFLEDQDPHYLGVAKDSSRTTLFSKIFFHWVNPLIRKAGRGLLHHPDDVFDLPETMTAHSVSQIVKKQWETLEKEVPVTQPHQVPRIKLLKLLYRCFGKQFFAIGFLKFLADCFGFAGPILLNAVVSFMENKSEPVYHGYLYAALLALSTLGAALANCHFALLMNELGIKIRAAMTTAVYKKTVGVSSSSLNRFTSGQIINFMSTDTDRNF